jgi:hypothetical protein
LAERRPISSQQGKAINRGLSRGERNHVRDSYYLLLDLQPPEHGQHHYPGTLGTPWQVWYMEEGDMQVATQLPALSFSFLLWPLPHTPQLQFLILPLPLP